MRWVLFAFTAPWSLTVGYGWVLLMKLIGAAEKLRWEKTLVLTAQWRPWAAKRWKYSTTLGRGIVYHGEWRSLPGLVYSRIQSHEHVHVRQIEDLMMLSFLVGLAVALYTGQWGLGAALWWSGGLWQVPDFITALLRGGNAYRDSEHERAAYGQTDLGPDGKSWLDTH